MKSVGVIQRLSRFSPFTNLPLILCVNYLALISFLAELKLDVRIAEAVLVLRQQIASFHQYDRQHTAPLLDLHFTTVRRTAGQAGCVAARRWARRLRRHSPKILPNTNISSQKLNQTFISGNRQKLIEERDWFIHFFKGNKWQNAFAVTNRGRVQCNRDIIIRMNW